MTTVTIQDYADVMSEPDAHFWDGRCTTVRHHPRLRLVLASLETGALGVLLFADLKRDVWMMAAGLVAHVSGDHVVLAGTSGMVLTLRVAGDTASGTMEADVTSRSPVTQRRVKFGVQMRKLTGPPGRPSASVR
jgi:hypothetical protein